MTALAVAGLSVRVMTEGAARDGFGVFALDLFGDVDTRAAACGWFDINSADGPGSVGNGGDALHVDADRLISTLSMLARRGDVSGWVAGSGFEGRPELLAEAAAALPLIGCAPAAVARLRDPAQFFEFLQRHGIDHPPISFENPNCNLDELSHWLLKDSGGCGGLHIRSAGGAGSEAPTRRHYFQRRVAGLPMSATFVGNGQGAILLGINEQIVRPLGALPYVFCGMLGPVEVAAAVRHRVQQIVRCLTAGFDIRGLASLDFMLDAGRVLVLEVNPRPPASMALYGGCRPMAMHVQACRDGSLPQPTARRGDADFADDEAGVEGFEIVFARRPLQLKPAAALRLAGWPDAHDLPHAGQCFAAGDPFCSVAARGRGSTELRARLHQRRETLLDSLETEL